MAAQIEAAAPGRRLRELIAAQSCQPVPAGVQTLAAAVRRRFPGRLRAILFYGSSRRVDRRDAVHDFYAIVEDYADLPRSHALLATLLPPNVYYLETGAGERKLRTKCTVISMAAFRRGTSPRWFHSYLWGRFCQPVTIVWASDEASAAALLDCLCNAVLTFVTRALPLAPVRFDARDLWVRGLAASYRSELRAERAAGAEELFDAGADHYRAVTAVAGGRYRAGAGGYTAEIGRRRRGLGRTAWAIRTVTGKLMSLARILKSGFTFDGGLDYIVWKLERHYGQPITVPDRVRRRPLLHSWGFFWRLYRRGVFR